MNMRVSNTPSGQVYPGYIIVWTDLMIKKTKYVLTIMKSECTTYNRYDNMTNGLFVNGTDSCTLKSKAMWWK